MQSQSLKSFIYVPYKFYYIFNFHSIMNNVIILYVVGVSKIALFM